ncbi:hypothetical protein [Alteromonas sp. a30]|uniref:hypothetical protein n=1 Tax=Alteromonas sp. a30 TaxID=2730917 RepID=UPI002282FE7E|nr:hypothetical protein [Alteromonas sp. a30]MCY7297252.1 hypothetical protein [Alteromonas sp. a30]
MTKQKTHLLNIASITAFSVSALFVGNVAAETASKQIESAQEAHLTQTQQTSVQESAKAGASGLLLEAALEAHNSTAHRDTDNQAIGRQNGAAASASRNQPECLQCHATGDKK